MIVEGKLKIDMHRGSNGIEQVQIRSTRPLQVMRLFEGKQPAEVLQLVPLIYSVCGIAQSHAALQACQKAEGRTVSNAIDHARGLLVQIEAAREHMLRVLMDWPQMLGRRMDAALVTPLTSVTDIFRRVLFDDEDGFRPDSRLSADITALSGKLYEMKDLFYRGVLGCPQDDWISIANLDDIYAWSTQSDTAAAQMIRHVSRAGWALAGRVDQSFLPVIADHEWQQVLTQSEAHSYAASPLWQGVPCETSSLVRQQDKPLIRHLLQYLGTGLLTRLLARLVELSDILDGIEHVLGSLHETDAKSEQLQSAGSGVGIGQVETARGRLVHRVEMSNGIVRRYLIIAPTEWNFHPDGVVVKSLMQLECVDEIMIRQQATMLVNAIDPCVEYEIRVH